MMRVTFSVLSLLLATCVAPATGEPVPGLHLQGEAAETFLATAEVVEMKDLPVGVTRSEKVTLSDGTVTCHAVWKTIDDYRPMVRFEDGGVEIGFSDSYRHEIAAYELDKLLGLGLVPPTVEREIGRKRGSLQLWVEAAMTEWERMQEGLHAPDSSDWNRQVHQVRLFHQLTYNTDFNNVRNILVAPGFQVFAIDHSRAFRTKGELLAPQDLKRFSSASLEALRGLDYQLLADKLGHWLTKRQIKALLERRDLILERAESLLAERGEEAVLFP